MKSTGMLMVVVLLFSAFVFADVTGQFKLNGNAAIKPAFAGAYIVRDPANPRIKAVEIMLSEGAIDAKAAEEDLDPHVNAINQEPVRSGNYVLLWARPNGKVSMNATLSEDMSQYVDSTDQGLKAELTTNTDQRIAGHVFTPKPVKTMDGSIYEIDVTFDVPVNRRPPGTSLPAGGGEAGKSFLALCAAVQAKNLNGIRENLTEDVYKMLTPDYNTEEENLESAVDILKARLPKKNVKVVGGESTSDAVLLEVEGEMFEGTNALYVIKMVKSGSHWVYEQSAPAGILR
jgi:hypothetical protein